MPSIVAKFQIAESSITADVTVSSEIGESKHSMETRLTQRYSTASVLRKLTAVIFRALEEIESRDLQPVQPVSEYVHGVKQKSVGGVVERLVYLVNSDTPGVEPWLVNTEAYDGYGECNCPDFIFGKKGNLSKRQRLQMGERNRSCLCKHLERAHLFQSLSFGKEVISRVRSNRAGSDADSNT